MISGVWYRVPEQLLQDTDMTRADIAVFAVIADRADGESCTLSAADIATKAGCSVLTVKRACKHLSERGYISIQRTAGGANTYKQLLLQPKRRGAGKQKNQPDPEIEKYKCLINKFELKEAE